MSYFCEIAKKTVTERCSLCACQRLPKGVTGAAKPIQADLDLGTFVPYFETVKRVPIVMAGVEYALSSGPATFTPDDIEEFVASQDDPALVPPRLKIGHTSRLSDPKVDGILKDGDDGVPSLGKFINIFHDEETMTAVGDIAGVPRWLAQMLKAGLLYPSRSIEGFQEAETVTGHTWGLVVHAVALLGCVWPGCSTLPDLALLYTEEGPDDLEVYDEGGNLIDAKAVMASRRPPRAATPVAASVNVDDVRRAYYDSLEANQMWWWVRAVYIDPFELIVDDDEGQLYRVPFTVSGDSFEFEDEQEVKITYVNASISARALQRSTIAAAASGGQLLAAFDDRTESRPETNEQENSMTRKQRIANLRARLGLTASQLPDDATDEQISQAALGETPEPTEPVTPPANGDEEEGEEDEDEEEAPPANQPPESRTASLPEGMVMVPAAQWASVQAGSQAALRREASDEDARRETTLEAALRERRIRPADVESMRNLHAAEASRPIFYQLLTQPVEKGGLAAGSVPLSEAGSLPAGDATSGDALEAAYDDNWLTPQERARRDSIKAGTFEAPSVQTDDPRSAAGASR